MTDPDIEPDDATPLSPEEREGLIPSHIALRKELNELEQQNILAADAWAFQRKRDPMPESFGRNLHKRMFGDVWRWAGRYRTTDKNIGASAWEVSIKLHEVLGNTQYWVEHNTFAHDEIAVRFHHGLVWVHPFPNGNGRWARLMADMLVVRLGKPRFSWGRNSIRNAGETRRDYVASLKAADAFDIARLLRFART